MPKREKGTCFKCGEKGHVVSECTGKAEANQINCVDSAWMDNDFQKRVKLILSNSSLNCEVELKALIDTGSPISFVKEKMIPSNFINYDNTATHFCGINGSKLNVVGTTAVDIVYDELQVKAQIYIVSEDTMSFPMIVGRDLLICNLNLVERMIRKMM